MFPVSGPRPASHESHNSPRGHDTANIRASLESFQPALIATFATVPIREPSPNFSTVTGKNEPVGSATRTEAGVLGSRSAWTSGKRGPRMRFFISTGEPSGDLHAANLVHALRARIPHAEFVGFGGPRLAGAGCRILYPLVDLAVMWFIEVFGLIGTFLRLLRQADRYLAEHKPDVVILIDYPGFHWLLAKRAKRRGIPVIYYVPPQIWAWASWRIRKIKERVDLVLCSLPFEPEWYQARGYAHAEFQGHPYFDELSRRTLDDDFLAEQQRRSDPLVVLLPGSRRKELTRNLPAMYRAAARVARQQPGIRFAVSCLHEQHADLAIEIARNLHETPRSGRHDAQQSIAPDRLEFFSGRTPELIRLADLAWAVSGSVGLELMYEALPTVVLYTIRPRDRILVRLFKRSKYISLVNLIAGDEVVPEYLTHEDASANLAQSALRWLQHPRERAAASHRLAALREKVARPGASERAAARIAEFMGVQSPASLYRGPHGTLTATDSADATASSSAPS